MFDIYTIEYIRKHIDNAEEYKMKNGKGYPFAYGTLIGLLEGIVGWMEFHGMNCITDIPKNPLDK